MKYRVVIEPRAAADIEAAYLWLAGRSPEGAVRWFNGINGSLATLESFPGRCPLAPENVFFAEEIRPLIHGKRLSRYRILFTVQDDAVRSSRGAAVTARAGGGGGRVRDGNQSPMQA